MNTQIDNRVRDRISRSIKGMGIYPVEDDITYQSLLRGAKGTSKPSARQILEMRRRATVT